MAGQSTSHQVGVLIAQLGTPDAPTAPALRRYLRQFLSDPRVIDYPPLLWQLLLRGIILRTRPKKSAKLYARIWLKEGSPLLVYSQAQVTALQARLGSAYRVILGMRYGSPSIAEALKTLEAEGIYRVIVLPMFPQFSSTTTASIYDAVYQAASRHHVPVSERKHLLPALRMVEPYFDHPAYIDALRQHLMQDIAVLHELPDHYIISFHGIPARYAQQGDPYPQQCEITAGLLAAAMGWRADQWTLCFQSQFGPEQWLKPFTDEVLTGLHARGIERPLIFSPGFVTDCLETLDELGSEGREQFEAGGGHSEQFHYVTCLNTHPAWIDALGQLVHANAGGWLNA